MSNFLAISTVTEVLRQMLDSAVARDLPGGSRCTAVRPMNNGSSDGLPEIGVNLYLYQVAPNASWRNADLPTRRNDGTLIQSPKMALDLYYLLTFYGDEKRLEPQQVLGSVLHAMHSHSALSKKQIGNAIKAVDYLSLSNLADEVEQVKFTPVPLSVEELYNLWSGLFQIPYSLSVAYQASVVFIDSEVSPQSALPVRIRNLYVSPIKQPVIEKIISQEPSGTLMQDDKRILPGNKLIILGRHLRNDRVLVRIGGMEVEPQEVEERKIELILSSPPLPLKALRAGPQGIQVVHERLLGTPPEPHKGTESNVEAFVLRPIIKSKKISKVKKTRSLLSAQLHLEMNPPVYEGQRLAVMLNEMSSSPEAYTFYRKASTEDSSSINLPLSGVKSGTYLIRVQVEGAESPLLVDTDPNSLTYNQYIGPVVVLKEESVS